MMPAWFPFVIGVFVGLMFAVDSRSDREKWRYSTKQSDAQRFFRALSNKRVCALLAKKLEIEADGGIPATEFVEYAVMECWKEIDDGKVKL